MSSELTADDDVRMDMGMLWAAVRRRLLRIVVVTAILLGATYAVLMFVPKTYESTASILVENRDTAYTRPANDNSSSTGAMSQEDLSALISSQIELVKSRDTLLSVVRTEDLTKVPEFNGTASSPLSFVTKYFRKASSATPEDVAVDALASHLLVVRERDSAIINITVRSTDPDRAATLANAIARADVSRRAGLSLSDTADASQWLEQQITQLRQRVADAETKVANFKVDNDLYTGTNSTSLVDQQMADISAQITAAQGRRSTAQSRAALIRGLMAAGQPIDSVEDVRNSVTIQQLMQQKAQLTSQKAQLLATLLPTHPSVKAVTAQITAIDRQIAVEGRRVADALDAEAKIEDASITALQKTLNDIKTKAGTATRQGVTLDQLQREAKADRDLLESYMTRYRDAAARTNANSALPDLRVVTLAAPATSPASPKTPLILGAVAFVTLAVQIGAILFGELLSGRALVERDRRAEPAFEEAGTIAPPRAGAWVRPSGVEPAGEGGAGVQASDEDAEAAAIANDADVVEAAANDEAEALRRRGLVGGLRSWFSRHARAAGSTLSAYEPPGTAERADETGAATVGADVEAADAVAEMRTRDVPPRETALPDAEADETDAANAERLANLSADLILGRTRVLMLASMDTRRESAVLADRLVADVLRRGLSVARVDAGSGLPSTEPGITDLAAEEAGFGDIVHKRGEEGLAEIPWGHLAVLDRRSSRPLTLVEALSDIYEVVLVDTGRIGMASSLPLFAGVPGRLVLVGEAQPEPARLESARADAESLGYSGIEFIAAPAWQAEVA